MWPNLCTPPRALVEEKKTLLDRLSILGARPSLARKNENRFW